MNIFTVLLVQPIFNALMFIRNIIPGGDLGIAIILVTILIKFILYLPSLSSIKSQRALQEIQPKIDEIRKKYKDNREEQSRQLMQVYKENKINPLSSCLPLLIQLPILFALYQVFIAGVHTDPDTGMLVQNSLDLLYAPLRDIYSTQMINETFLGIVDLTKSGNIILAVVAGVFQFFQSRMLISKRPPKVPGAQDEAMASSVSRSMTYFMPIITVFFAYRFPAGLALYWTVSTLFSLVQQYFFLRKKPESDQPVVTT